MAVNKDKNVQILVTFPHETVIEIEKFWHDNKLKNRNEAIRVLIRRGLESK